jgi:hypothetical protein
MDTTYPIGFEVTPRRHRAPVVRRRYAHGCDRSSGPLATRWPVAGRAAPETRVTLATDDTRSLYKPHRYTPAKKHVTVVSQAAVRTTFRCGDDVPSHPLAVRLAAVVDHLQALPVLACVQL